MKKTITSSIGRIQFHLEEDAHQKLSNYIDAISRSMQGSAGRDEIMADIEARIAELLLQRIKNPQQVVTLTEVDEIIGIMGSPEAFGGGGSGKEENSYAGTHHAYKRLFRDPDDKVIFGVCSGISHHFAIDPIFLRLGFGLSVLLGGFGFILYILLAIIIPKARTLAEKLEMRGERADINNIKRTVEEELNDLKKKVENVKSDFKSGRYRNTGRDFGQRVGEFFSGLGHGVGSVVGAVIKGVFAFIGFLLVCAFSLILIALFISLLGGVNIIHMHGANGHWMNYSLHSLFTFFAVTGTARIVLMWGIGLFVGVPLLALIFRIGRAVIGLHGKMQWLRITLFTAWMIGLLLILLGAFQSYEGLSVSGSTSETIEFNTSAKKLYVTMPENEPGDVKMSFKMDSLNLFVSDDYIYKGTPSICIQPSSDTDFHLKVEKFVRGSTEAGAVISAKEVEYTFSQKDSNLYLNPYFQLKEGTVWRKQKIDIELQVPVNRMIYLPKGIDDIMCSRVHMQHEKTGGHTWIMSTSGLVAADSL